MPQIRFICKQESPTLHVDQGGPPEEGNQSLKPQAAFDCAPIEGGCTPPHTLYDLRNTCATLLLGKGTHPKVVQEL